MNNFFSFFIFELKRFVSRKNLIVFFLFFVLSLYFVHEGTHQYKNTLKNKETFQRLEELKVRKYINYTQYGVYGFNLIFIPSPISTLFINSSVISELTSNVNSSNVLKIYNSFKGKNLYVDSPRGFKDFSGVILLFGSILALYFGYDSLRHKEYLKFLASICNYRRLFYFILLPRIMLLTVFFLSLIGIALPLMAMNGVYIPGTEIPKILHYLLVMFFLVITFFLIGTVAGTLKSKFVGLASTVTIWFVSVFLIPGVVDRLVASKAESIWSNYNLEIGKLKLMMDFERAALDEAQRYTSMSEKVKSERKLVEGFWNNELKKIQSLENKMQSEMRKNFRYFQSLSMIFPSTFYLSVNNEISSKGYKNFFEFYDYIMGLKKKFVRFYINKKFYENYSEVVSFVKEDENIFYAQSRLPENFSIGASLNLFYIIVLSGVSYFRLKKSLFGLPDRQFQDLSDLELELESGRTVVLLTGENGLIGQVYNFFSSKDMGFSGQVMLDNNNIAGTEDRKDFIYVCRPGEIPVDIKVGAFIRFVSRLMGISWSEAEKIYAALGLVKIEKKHFGELREADRGRVLFGLVRLKESKIYMIHDLAGGMPVDFAMEVIEGLKDCEEKQEIILYLTLDVLFAAKIADRLTYLVTDPTVPRRIDDYKKM